MASVLCRRVKFSHAARLIAVRPPEAVTAAGHPPPPASRRACHSASPSLGAVVSSVSPAAAVHLQDCLQDGGAAALKRTLVFLAYQAVPTGDVVAVFQHLLAVGEAADVGSRVLGQLGRRGDVDAMRHVYQGMLGCNPGAHLDATHVNRFIDVLLRDGRLGEALTVLDDMEHVGGTMEPYFKTYNMLIHHMLRSGDADSGKTLFDRMLSRGIRADGYMMASVLAARTGAQPNAGDVDSALQALMTDDAVTDAVPYNILLHKACLAGHVDGVTHVVGAMTLRNVKPDAATARTVMQGFMRLAAGGGGAGTLDSLPPVLATLVDGNPALGSRLYVAADKTLQWARRLDAEVPYPITLAFFRSLLRAGVYSRSGAHPGLGPLASANALLHPVAHAVNATGVRVNTVALYVHTLLEDIVAAARDAPVGAPTPQGLFWVDDAGALHAKDLHVFVGNDVSKTTATVKAFAKGLEPTLRFSATRTPKTLVVPGSRLVAWATKAGRKRRGIRPHWRPEAAGGQPAQK